MKKLKLLVLFLSFMMKPLWANNSNYDFEPLTPKKEKLNCRKIKNDVILGTDSAKYSHVEKSKLIEIRDCYSVQILGKKFYTISFVHVVDGADKQTLKLTADILSKQNSNLPLLVLRSEDVDSFDFARAPTSHQFNTKLDFLWGRDRHSGAPMVRIQKTDAANSISFDTKFDITSNRFINAFQNLDFN